MYHITLLSDTGLNLSFTANNNYLGKKKMFLIKARRRMLCLPSNVFWKTKTVKVNRPPSRVETWSRHTTLNTISLQPVQKERRLHENSTHSWAAGKERSLFITSWSASMWLREEQWINAVILILFKWPLDVVQSHARQSG